MSDTTCLELRAASVVTFGDIPFSSPFAVDGWFRPHRTLWGEWEDENYNYSPDNYPPQALLYQTGAGGNAWGTYLLQGGILLFQVFAANHYWAVSNNLYPLPANDWVHLAAEYSYPHCRVYLNGVLANTSSAATSPTVVNSSEPLRLGGTPAQAPDYMPSPCLPYLGRVSWLRVSNISRAPYAIRAPGDPPAVDGNTLALWRFNEGSGLTADNAQGTAAYDGALTSCVWAVSAGDGKPRAAAPRAAYEVVAAWATPPYGAQGGTL